MSSSVLDNLPSPIVNTLIEVLNPALDLGGEVGWQQLLDQLLVGPGVRQPEQR